MSPKAPSPATSDRRLAQLEALLLAAEQRITQSGAQSLKARDLASDIGIALGGLYNIVKDLDTLLLLVTARTQARLDSAATEATAHLPMSNRAEATERLVAVAISYLDFAQSHLELWRMMFSVRIAAPLPDWAVQDQLRLFRHIAEPLHVVMPDLTAELLTIRARTLFAAVHGVISIGLEERLIAVPRQKLTEEIAWLTRAACR